MRDVTARFLIGPSSVVGVASRNDIQHEPGTDFQNTVVAMAIDWYGFGFGSLVIAGGILGYKRKGSLPSLIAGLIFGLLLEFGAFQLSFDPNNILLSLVVSAVLGLVMGIRFQKSGKVMPAGLVALLSILNLGRLVLRLL
ncbi:LOW QUALITY PROTEIN: transmembrane protein 14A-like [Lampetra fluviatilis]